MHEGLILYHLLSEERDDIIIKTDEDGFVRHATPAIRQLGFSLSDMLIWPHVLDLADDRFRPGIADAFDSALEGHHSHEWVEFSSPLAGGRGQWFAIRFGALKDDAGNIRGTLAVIRNLGEAKKLEEQLFRAELTDPLTGLTNRQAWMEMLKHLVLNAKPACLALIDIDFFKAINLHYGMSSGDRLLVTFADFLRGQTPGDVSISRVGPSRFSMLFPGWSTVRARNLCREMVHVLSSLRCTDWRHRFSVTASVGIGNVGADVDATVNAVEAALRLARAKGGNTVIADRTIADLRAL